MEQKDIFYRIGEAILGSVREKTSKIKAEFYHLSGADAHTAQIWDDQNETWKSTTLHLDPELAADLMQELQDQTDADEEFARWNKLIYMVNDQQQFATQFVWDEDFAREVEVAEAAAIADALEEE